MKKCKVPVQKGKINPDPITMAIETLISLEQKVFGDKKDQQSRRSAQNPKLKKVIIQRSLFMKKCKVPVQKGPIEADPITMAMETFDQKVYGDKKDQQSRRSAQKPKLKMPKK